MSSSWPGWARVRLRRVATRKRQRPFRGAPPGSRPRDRERSRGQSLVELALVTPILLVLLLGAVDLGRLFYAQIAVANAAREGAMVGASNPTSYVGGAACDVTTNAVTCAATREGQGGFVTVDPADVAMTCTPSCATRYGTAVTVTVTGHFQLLTPLMWIFTGGPNVTFDRTAEADVVITPAAAGFSTPAPSSSSSPAPSSSATPAPSASATPSPSPTCAPPFVGFTTYQQNRNKAIDFTSTSTPTAGACAISYWRWDFGDGSTGAGAVGTTSHDYGKANEGMTFTVTLTVTTPDGTFSYVTTLTTQS